MKREIKVGAKVHYTSPNGKKENGIVKVLSKYIAFVVYHCNNDWGNYKDYTGQSTELKALSFGWVDDGGNILKEFCDHYYLQNNSKWTPINKKTCQFCGDVVY